MRYLIALQEDRIVDRLGGDEVVEEPGEGVVEPQRQPVDPEGEAGADLEVEAAVGVWVVGGADREKQGHCRDDIGVGRCGVGRRALDG